MATEIQEIPLEPEGATEITEENPPEIAEENAEENKENIDPRISEPEPIPTPKPAPKPKAARAKGRPKGAVNKKPKPALKPKPPPPEESDEELPDYVQEAVQQQPQPPTRHDVAAALFQMLQTHEHVRRNARVNKYRGWVSSFS